MLSLLADALMIATGMDPLPKHHNRQTDAGWNDRFVSSRMQGLDTQSRRFNTARDLHW